MNIKYISNLTSAPLLLSILIFTFSCSQPKNKEPDKWDEFYTRLLFIESVSFTIHGSKPITEIILDHRGKEEKEEERNKNLGRFSKKERKKIEAQGIKWNPKYDFEDSWRIWELNLKKDLIKNYLVVHFPVNASDFDFVFFVNIIETSKVIQKNYPLFRKYVDFDFDPLEVVFDISNKESIFWNEIFNGEKSQEKICLIGILFGYGLENSYPYSLLFHKNKTGRIGEFASNLFNQVVSIEGFHKIKYISPSKFEIPGFKSFSNPDYIIEKYQKEKEIIKNLYKGKNVEAVTMNSLYGI